VCVKCGGERKEIVNTFSLFLPVKGSELDVPRKEVW
jgi:hypothetical protein